MRKLLHKTVFGFDNALLTVSAFFLLAATLLMFVNAVMRSIGLGGFTWSDELSVILTIFMVFLTQPILEYSDNQLSTGILKNIPMSEGKKVALEIIRGIIIILLIGFMLYYCWQNVQRAMQYDYLTSVLRFPRYILYTCVFVSFALIIINWVVKIFCRKRAE